MTGRADNSRVTKYGKMIDKRGWILYNDIRVIRREL